MMAPTGVLSKTQESVPLEGHQGVPLEALTGVLLRVPTGVPLKTPGECATRGALGRAIGAASSVL